MLSYLGWGSDEPDPEAEALNKAAAQLLEAEAQHAQEPAQLDTEIPEAELPGLVEKTREEIRKLCSTEEHQHLRYRTVDGKDHPIETCPLLTQVSIRRYLIINCADPATSAEKIVQTLSWRQRAFRRTENSDGSDPFKRAEELLKEVRRIRPLGQSTDGHVIYGVDCCWGHFVDPEAGVTELDVYRMILLGVEAAVEQADKVGKDRIILIVYGGPPPAQLGLAVGRSLEIHYVGRMECCVIYPVPSVWAYAASAAFLFLRESNRRRMAVVTEEQECVERARLKGPEQLPEEWRGGVEGANERHQPDSALLTSLLFEYLNPFGASPSDLQQALEGTQSGWESWLPW